MGKVGTDKQDPMKIKSILGNLKQLVLYHKKADQKWREKKLFFYVLAPVEKGERDFP